MLMPTKRNKQKEISSSQFATKVICERKKKESFLKNNVWHAASLNVSLDFITRIQVWSFRSFVWIAQLCHFDCTCRNTIAKQAEAIASRSTYRHTTGRESPPTSQDQWTVHAVAGYPEQTSARDAEHSLADGTRPKTPWVMLPSSR